MEISVYTELINIQQDMIRHLQKQLEEAHTLVDELKTNKTNKTNKTPSNPMITVTPPLPTAELEEQEQSEPPKYLEVPEPKDRDCSESNLNCKKEASRYQHEGRIRRMDFSGVYHDLSNLEQEIDRQFGKLSVSTLRAYKISIGRYLQLDLGRENTLVQEAYHTPVKANNIEDTRSYDELAKLFKDKAEDLDEQSEHRLMYALYGYFPPLRQIVWMNCEFGDLNNSDETKNYMDIVNGVLKINVDKSGSPSQKRIIKIPQGFIDWAQKMKYECKGKMWYQSMDRLNIVIRKVIYKRPIQTLRHAYQSQQVNNGVSKQVFEEACAALGHTPQTALSHYATNIDSDKFYH